MNFDFPPDLKQLIADRMSSVEYPSEDDLLRDALRALAKDEEDLVAVREAIADWEAGDEGIPLKDAFSELRTKFGIPRDA